MALTAPHRLGRIAAGAALAFALCILALALLEGAGVGGQLVAWMTIAVPFALYAGLGLASSTSDSAELATAGSRVAGAFAGMAAAAQWSAAAFILGAPAAPAFAAYGGPPMLMALTGGYVLAAVLIAPFLRNSCARTLPEFLGARYGGLVRLLAVAVLTVCALLLLTAFIKAAVAAAAGTLPFPEKIARAAMLAMLIVCVLPGGMAGVTATQVAEYAVLLVGALAALLMSTDAPQGVPVIVAHGGIAASETVGLSPAAGVALPAAELFDNGELMLCLMTGTASLPHMLIHSMITRGMRQARASATWSLLFVIMLAMVLPAQATLAPDNAGLFSGLLGVIFLSAMLAGTSALLLTLASSLDHDLWRALPAWRAPTEAVGARRMSGLRPLMLIAAVLAAYAAQKQALEPRIMLACAFSLSAAGLFPALVLGIWWRRASAAGAAAGMVAGFALCVLYLVVSRYFPQAAIRLFGMSALLDPISGRALVDAQRVLADPGWLADVPASAANPLAGNVGWLNIDPAACGILGLAAGFATLIVVSLLGRAPPAESRAWLEALHAPGGLSGRDSPER